MCKILRRNSLLMWFVLNSVLLTNAFETYSETDQLAEESVGGYESKEGLQETTTNTNLISSIEQTIAVKEEQSVKTSVEDEPIDPLQKILPKVKFNCKGKSEGYYADNEFCQVFHYCKTNGFRFTFMCPPESYYNDKLMACEFNATLSKCVDRQKLNITQNIDINTVNDTSVKESTEQTIEILQKSSSQIKTNTETSESVSTTTVEPMKPMADPYLTRKRTHNGFKPKTMADKPKARNNTENISPEMRSHNQKTQNETKVNITQTILPFSGFRKFNRNKNQVKNNSQSVMNDIKNINNSTNSSEVHHRIPSNALPVLKSIRPQLLTNSNQVRNYRNKSRDKTATTATTTSSTTTTTTSYPSLLGPTFRDSTTVSPFDYFTPIFNSDTNFPLTSDFFPLSMHKKPENAERDKLNQRKSHMTQNYYNSIRHTTRPHFQKESQIEETLKQSETNSPYAPSEVLPRYKFSRSPLFDSHQQEQYNKPETLPSESQIQEIIERLKQMDINQHSDYSGADTSIEPNEDMDESVHITRKRREKGKHKQFLTVPLLVPTGVSKSDLRRKLSSTLLKPTVLPLTESGEEMPAYVLQFQETNGLRKPKNLKHRSKRQAFNWRPYQSNPFISNTYYLPMNSMSAPIYSPFHNHMRHTLPMNTFRSRHLEIGERNGFPLNPSAQQHIPYYIPPKQPLFGSPFIGSNHFRDNNIYDLSEFSDFYENPFIKRPVPIVANDMSPYRSVSLRKPGFKRPPRREKIPEIKKNNNTTAKTDIRTTVRPLNSMPVSPRPYSQPIVKQQFYARNSNPFSDFSDENLNEAIKAFDSSEDNLQPLDPDFNSNPFFHFNSPQISNDFIPIIPKTLPFADTLNGRSSRINTFSETPVNSYVSDDFPPLPKFGDSQFRLPFIDIPDPTLTNLDYRFNSDNSSNNQTIERKQDNNTRYSTPYSPESIFNTNTENHTSNETERNPNHNYDNIDKDRLQSDQTIDTKHNSRLIPSPSLNWDNIVGQYHKQNVSVTNRPQISVNKDDSNEQKESEIWKKRVSYGTRLSGSVNKYSQNPEISVKTSVSSVSSLQPEASNQVMISRKFGSSVLSSQPVEEHKKSINELYNQRAFDRLMLFNYYNHLNLQKFKTSTTTTTTVSPLDGKYPSTSHWSIRGWTGQYYPHSSKPSTATSTAAPVLTTNSNIEYLDLFESEAKISETTTELPQTTSPDIPEPPYRKVFNSKMGATFHSNKYSKPYSLSNKTRSDISNYILTRL